MDEALAAARDAAAAGEVPVGAVVVSPAGDYVLYWMQQSQRATHNPALEYAAAEANRLKLSLVVGFGLMDDYPEANARHYLFMLQGLADEMDVDLRLPGTRKNLRRQRRFDRGITQVELLQQHLALRRPRRRGTRIHILLIAHRFSL